ncbi:hypothetical protein KHY18_22475 [Acidovorax sp. CCYZU-2555]|nr:hypothetical protein [Acidovorax sp. CCYZU-2555]
MLWLKLSKLLPEYPDVKLEIHIGYGLIDIVTERFDAGVRMGDQIAKDMIAVRISPDFRRAVAAAPTYFAHRPQPRTPQDLRPCITAPICAWRRSGGSTPGSLSRREERSTFRCPDS